VFYTSVSSKWLCEQPEQLLLECRKSTFHSWSSITWCQIGMWYVISAHGIGPAFFQETINSERYVRLRPLQCQKPASILKGHPV
jgi:hypothetical protein